MPTQEFSVELDTNYEACQDCRDLPGAFLYFDRLRLAEPLRLCSVCSSFRIATQGGILEQNPTRTAFEHVVKHDSQDSSEPLIKVVTNGYQCPNCDEIFGVAAFPIPEVKTGWSLNMEAEQVCDDDDWENTIFTKKEDVLKEVQYWTCGHDCAMLVEDEPLPEVMHPIYECPDCESIYMEEAEARSCCAYRRRRN